MGKSKQEALKRYNLTEEVYEDNLDWVLQHRIVKKWERNREKNPGE